jgi:ribosomal protein S18 acetylase RimI-like enzyme
MPSLIIRDAVIADLAAVRSCLVETWHATYDIIYGADEVTRITDSWRSMPVLRRQLADAEHTFLVAEREGIIVATALLQRVDATLAHLHRLYVTPRYQRQAIGPALLAVTLQHAPEGARVRCEVARPNATAIAFYKAHGFAQTGVNTNDDTFIYERLPEPGTVLGHSNP